MSSDLVKMMAAVIASGYVRRGLEPGEAADKSVKLAHAISVETDLLVERDPETVPVVADEVIEAIRADHAAEGNHHFSSTTSSASNTPTSNS